MRGQPRIVARGGGERVLTVALIGLMSMETAQSLADEAGMTCAFPASAAAPGPVIEFSIQPTPSLRDLPGLSRVSLLLNNKIRMPGVARPTAERGNEAVVLRGISARKITYTIGVHLTGTAVLQISAPGSSEAPTTRTGTCTGHTGPMQNWIDK